MFGHIFFLLPNMVLYCLFHIEASFVRKNVYSFPKRIVVCFIDQDFIGNKFE